MAFENLGGQLLSLDQLSNPFGAMQAGEQDANALALQQQQVQQGQAAAQQQQAAVTKSQAQAVDMQHFLANPTPEAGAAIQAKYKNDFSGFKSMWDQRDKSAQTADLTNLGSVVSAINAGSPDVAAKLVSDRVAANAAAGVQQPGVAALNDALQSGNAKLAKGLASAMILAATGDPEKLATLGDSANKPVTLGKDSKLVDPTTGKVIADNSSADYKTIKGADGAEHLVKIGGNDAGGPTVGAGGFAKIYSEFTAPTEGGYANNDGGTGAPVNYGVNQHANPDVDVKSLTPTAAAGILHDRYWAPLGLDNVSDPKMQAVAFDTAVNMGVGTAKAMMKASGGDVDKMLQFRQQRYNAIGGPNLLNWTARNAKLQAYVGSGDDASDVTDVTPKALLAANQADTGLTGPDYLKTLPPGRQQLVSAIVRGDIPVSGLRSPKMLSLVEDASRVDPSFSAADYPTRQAMRKSATSGPIATNVTALNTALRHSETITNLIPQISGAKVPLIGNLYNSAANGIAQMSGSGPIKSYTSAQGHFSEELAKAFKGSSNTSDAAISRNLADLDPSGSDEQKKAALSTLTEMLGGRIDELVQQYQTAMGAGAMPPGLSPKALAVYKSYHDGATPADAGVVSAGSGAATPAAVKPYTAPVQVQTAAQAMALPPGTVFITPDGRRKVR